MDHVSNASEQTAILQILQVLLRHAPAEALYELQASRTPLPNNLREAIKEGLKNKAALAG